MTFNKILLTISLGLFVQGCTQGSSGSTSSSSAFTAQSAEGEVVDVIIGEGGEVGEEGGEQTPPGEGTPGNDDTRDPEQEGEQDTAAASCVPTIPNFQGTCEQRQAQLINYMITFDPGRGLNNLPNCGQTTNTIDAIRGNTDLTAGGVGQIEGTLVALKTGTLDRFRSTNSIVQANVANFVRGTDLKVMAEQVGDIRGTNVLVNANSIANLDGGTELCVRADSMNLVAAAQAAPGEITSSQFNHGDFGPRTAGGTLTINILDMRDRLGGHGATLRNTHVNTIIDCSEAGVDERVGRPALQRLQLINSTYGQIQKVNCL